MIDVTSRQTMQLEAARVTNFGCFRDSGEVPIEEVTALIAENENGKTTFLRALAWFCDESAFDEEDRWDGADQKGRLDLVALTFTVNGAARDAMLGSGVEPPERVRIVRDTAGSCRVEDPVTGVVIEPGDGETPFQKARRELHTFLLRRGNPDQDLQRITGLLDGSGPGSGLAPSLAASIRGDVIPQLPADARTEAEALTAQFEMLEAVPGDRVVAPLIELLGPYIPQIVYFEETVDYIEDDVGYAELSGDQRRYRTMLNLGRVGGIDLLEALSLPGHERQLQGLAAGKTLSAEATRYWQGDPLTFYINLDESRIIVSLDHKGRHQRPSRRSRGLRWQLGFYVNFVAEVAGDLAGSVLLLDEPGLHLHIKQQPKLLELFDDIVSSGCQIIYSTHLSHMLAPDKPHRFRPLVADPEAAGAAIVIPNIMAVPSKSDALYPVRQALGMGIADAIGLGDSNVVAEGWAERYVLLEMSNFCREAGKTALAETTTILPSGGSGKKMLPFAAMAVSEKTRVVVLVDDDKAGRDTATLIEKTLPRAVPVIHTHAAEKPTGLELEDLFSRDYFVQLVNGGHSDVKDYKPISPEELNEKKPVCDAVKEAFKAHGLGDFQKFRAAIELQRLHELETPPDDETLDRFADLFERLNSALDSG